MIMMTKQADYSIVRLAVLVLIMMSTITMRVAENWHNNKAMVCLLPDIMTPFLRLNPENCFAGKQPELPPVITTLLVERNLQQGVDFMIDQHFCQDKLSDTYYEKRLSYTMFIGTAVEAKSYEKILCPEKLPSSLFIFTRAQIYSEAQQKELFEVATAVAYELDKTWGRPLWRGVNAEQLGDIHSSELNWDKSLEAYERAIMSYSDEPMLSPVYLARTYGSMAKVAQQAGHISQALSYYENAFQLYSEVPLPLIQEYTAVTWQLHAEDTASITARLLALAANKQTDYKFLYRLAVSLIDNASPNMAPVKKISADFEAILPASYYVALQGTVARHETNFLASQEMFESALTGNDIEDIDLRAEILSRLAIVYILDEQYKLGIETQEKIVTLKPDNGQAWYQLAIFYEVSGQVDSAKRAVGQALILQPNNEMYLNFARQLETTNK
jgi:tetratricopeptide (TPR) repeat protein